MKGTTGSARSGDGLDTRRRRILFRAWRRGTREADLLLGPFADAYIHALDEADLAAFEALLDVPDSDVFNWIVGRRPVPDDHATKLLDAIVAFHAGTHARR